MAGKLTVYVVDDSRTQAEIARALLEKAGHEVIISTASQEALARIPAVKPDCVLFDLMMPGLDGFEICRRLRASDLPHRPRIVAMTGWGREEDRARTAAAGFDAHLVKPVDVATLARLLEESTSH